MYRLRKIIVILKEIGVEFLAEMFVLSSPEPKKWFKMSFYRPMNVPVVWTQGKRIIYLTDLGSQVVNAQLSSLSIVFIKN